jgi:membrane-associated protein
VAGTRSEIAFSFVTPADKIHTVAQALANVPAAFNPLNPQSLLESAGIWALWIVIFAETGLLIGFFLPGDTILFIAGIASSPFAAEVLHAKLPIVPLLIVTPIAAILGAQLGHFLGMRLGVRMFDRPNSRIFRREYVTKTEEYFEKFGPAKAIVLARFIPIVRTFLNPVAGVLEISPRRFFIWNVVGAVIWTDGVLLAGHLLAKQITDHIPPDKIDNYILPVIILIVLIAAIPLVLDLIRRRRERRRRAEQEQPQRRPAHRR